LPPNAPPEANEGCLAYPSAAQDTEKLPRHEPEGERYAPGE